MSMRLRLIDALRKAANKELPEGRVYLRSDDSATLTTDCLFLTHEDIYPNEDEEVDDDAVEDVPRQAVEAGFPVEGLDTYALENTGSRAERFVNPPSDALLLESFEYYWRYDAWLPQPGTRRPI